MKALRPNTMMELKCSMSLEIANIVHVDYSNPLSPLFYIRIA